jgi:hypothetical protein
MVMGSTQPLTAMSTRSTSVGLEVTTLTPPMSRFFRCESRGVSQPYASSRLVRLVALSLPLYSLRLYSPILGLGRLHETFRFISVTISRTISRTPWTGDQLVLC